MQSVEVTAKSLPEATRVAADKLGVSADRIRLTVLEETKGLFGRQTIRARAELLEMEVVVEAEAVNGNLEAEAPAKAKGRKKTKAADPVAPEVAVVPTAPAPTTNKPAPKRVGRLAKDPAAPVEASEAVAESDVDETQEKEIIATVDDAEALVDLVRGLLDGSNLNVTVSVGSMTGKYVNVVLDGKDTAFLVGKHGEVLNALQYLVNIIASRKIDNGVRATLDGNDYRRRREDALTNYATKIANEVKARREEAVLDALPAFERRIVHKALQAIDGVTTYSEGEEPNRRVVIAPAE